jgi:hypothetical protein
MSYLLSFRSFTDGGTVKYAFDPELKSDRGYFQCPECADVFYGQVLARHHPWCRQVGKGFEPCVYYFGPEQVRRAKAKAAKHNDPRVGWYGISVALLRELGLGDLLKAEPEPVAS